MLHPLSSIEEEIVKAWLLRDTKMSDYENIERISNAYNISEDVVELILIHAEVL